MSWRTIMRIAAGMAIGFGLASVPFLQYSARGHAHRGSDHHAHHHAH